MVENIVNYLNQKLAITNYFAKTYELSTRLSEEDKVYPVIYCSKGQLDPVAEFDKHDGMSYWRKDGEISIEEVDSDISCVKNIEITIPLVLIGAVKKTKQNADDLYSDDRMAQTIIRQLNENNQTLRDTLGAKMIDITSPSYDTDNISIIESEFDVEGFRDLDRKVSLVKISVNTLIRADISCLKTECDDVQVFECGDDAIIQINGTFFTTATPGSTENINVHDSAGADVGSKVGSDYVIADGTVENSDQSYQDNTAKAEGTFVLPDINHTDTDGSTSTLPAQTPMVCKTPSQVYQNLYSFFFQDDNDEEINISSILPAMGTSTGIIECWFWIDDFSESRTLWAFGDTDGDEFLFARILTDGTVDIFCREAGVNIWIYRSNAGDVSTNQWYHLKIYHDGVEMKGELDGVALSGGFTVDVDKTRWITDMGGLDNLYIGIQKRNSISAQRMVGKIYDFVFANSDTASGDDAYNGGTPNDRSGIDDGVAYYRPSNSSWNGSNYDVTDQIGSNDVTTAGLIEEERIGMTP